MFEIISTISSGLVGIVAGWILRGILEQSKGASGSANPADQLLNYNDVAQRIWDLTQEVSADVDLHQDRVRAADNALRKSSIGGETPVVLVQAVSQIVEANRDMQQQLDHAREKLQSQAEELQSAKHSATTDPLTHIRNRRALDEHLKTRFELRDQAAHPTTIALFDVDHFKRFNDTYGHQAGDYILKKVAQVLFARLHHYGIAARFGGEEFSVVLDDQRAEQIAQVIETVRAEISQREIELEGEWLRITLSCGVSELDPADTLEQWVERADQALYQAKHDGRNRGYRNEMGRMIPLKNPEAESEAAKLAESQAAALELLRAGEHLHASLTARDIPLTAVILQIDGEELAVEEIMKQVRLQVRGIDRMGKLAAAEVAVWMPSINVAGAKEWLERFSNQVVKSPEIRKAGCRGLRAGCAVTQAGVTFAQAVATARQCAAPLKI